MKLLIVTGGIASGKSEVADLLRSKGVITVSADVVARDVSVFFLCIEKEEKKYDDVVTNNTQRLSLQKQKA